MNKKTIVVGGEIESPEIISMVEEWVSASSDVRLIRNGSPYDISSVCNMIKGQLADAGIIVTDLGVDAAVLANRASDIIIAIAPFDEYTVSKTMDTYRVNVLCVGAGVLGPSVGQHIINIFLDKLIEREKE